MTVQFSQIYIQPGVSFPFTHHFQKHISEVISSLVESSAGFVDRFGGDFALMFRISAKRDLQENEVRGPTVFRKAKDVEYTVFLPFDVISRNPDVPRMALRALFQGVCSVIESLEIDSSRVAELQGAIIEGICSDPKMFE